MIRKIVKSGSAGGRSDADDPFRSESGSEGILLVRRDGIVLFPTTYSNQKTSRRSGWELCLEEIIERICNHSGHCKRHKDVLWNQECRKMFHGASR
jgi:hypothetical protein